MRLFTNEHTWSGGFYELAIELGLRSEARLEAAINAIWQDARLEGCYTRRDLEPAEQPRVEPTLEMREKYAHLLGVATLPGGGRAACGTFIIRQEDGIDWLGFYIPMGALSTIYDVGAFPFNDGKASQHWREHLDAWLAEIAQTVFAAAPFDLAIIGDEASGDVSAAEFAVSGVPESRWHGYLWREDKKLIWYPPTIYTAPISFA